MRALDCSAIAIVPGVETAQFAHLESEQITVLNDLVDLEQISTNCDAAITHGGNGTIANLPAEGISTLIVPMTLEHALFAFRLTERGLVYQFNMFAPDRDVTDSIQRLILPRPTRLLDFNLRCE